MLTKEEINKQVEQEELELFLIQHEERRARLKLEEEEKTEKARRSAELEFENKKLADYRRKEAEKAILLSKDSVEYSDDLASEICRRVASGEVLKAICEDATMPTVRLVQDWFEDKEKVFFRTSYDRAIKMRDKVFEDEIIMIADDSSNDYIEKINSKTGETFRVLDAEAMTRSKMRIEARMKILRANNPARWGDNPSASEAAAKMLQNFSPKVVIQFVEAPKEFARGDDARVIVQAPENSMPLDSRDIEYLEKREKLLNNKVA